MGTGKRRDGSQTSSWKRRSLGGAYRAVQRETTRRRQPSAPCHRIPITRYKRSGRKLQHFTEARKRDGGGGGVTHANTFRVTQRDNVQILNARAQIHTLFFFPRHRRRTRAQVMQAVRLSSR